VLKHATLDSQQSSEVEPASHSFNTFFMILNTLFVPASTRLQQFNLSLCELAPKHACEVAAVVAFAVVGSIHESVRIGGTCACVYVCVYAHVYVYEVSVCVTVIVCVCGCTCVCVCACLCV